MNMQPKWMNISENPVKAVLTIFIGTFLVLLFIYSAYQHRDIINARLLLAKEQTVLVEIQKRFISKEFESIVSDLMYLNKSPIFQNFINERNEKSAIENEWIVFSNSKKHYDQIRYIDILGNEIIRVNFNKGQSTKADDKYLQNKKDRYYFTETLKLSEGQLYLSKFDLNVENNELELPIKPMIRFGLPIVDQTKSVRGVLVVNYLGKYIIDEIKKNTNKNNSLIQLVNEDGYWLAGPDSATEWAFMYPDKKQQTFKTKFPVEWNRICKEKEGQFFSSNGLFTFSAVHAVRELQSMLLGADDDVIKCESSDGAWFIISHVPASAADYANDENSYLISIGNIFRAPLLCFAMMTISLLVALLLVLYLSGNEKIKTLATYDSMSGCYNRASGLGIMQSIIKQNNDIAICFIDINGLKEVNDFLGHDSGDDLIRTSVQMMQESVRNIDLVIRLGGDEFLICFPNTTAEHAEAVWQRIVDKIQEINQEGDKKFLISLSHGIAALKNNYGYSLDTVIKEADIKMYAEKKSIKGIGFSVIKG